jgi:hypothetical protein
MARLDEIRERLRDLSPLLALHAPDDIAYLLAEVERLTPRWIPVGERVPVGEEYVLVHLSCGAQVVGWLCADGEWWTPDHYAEQGPCTCDEATHWQPLPEPPTEGV